MNKKQLSTIITFGVIAVIAITAFLLRKTDYSHLAFKCDKIASDILLEHKVTTETPLKTTHQRVTAFRKKSQSIEKEFLLPQKQLLSEIKNSFVTNTALAPVRLGKIQKKQTKKEHILILDFFYKNHKELKGQTSRRPAYISSVVFDWDGAI